MNRFLAAGAAFLFLVSSSSLANATTITFDDLGIISPVFGDPDDGVYDVGSGYEIDATGGTGGRFNSIIHAVDSGNAFQSGGNNTRSFLWGENPNSDAVLILARSDNTLFDLISLNYHGWNNNFGTLLTLKGLKADNSIVTANLVVTAFHSAPYHFTALPGSFAGLQSVTFEVAGGASGSVSQLDNISVNQSVAVPEPATWAMMIMGFGAAGSVLRRRRTTVTL